MNITVHGVDGLRPVRYTIKDHGTSVGEFTKTEAKERGYHGDFALRRRSDGLILQSEENWEDSAAREGDAFDLIAVTDPRVATAKEAAKSPEPGVVRAPDPTRLEKARAELKAAEAEAEV